MRDKEKEDDIINQIVKICEDAGELDRRARVVRAPVDNWSEGRSALLSRALAIWTQRWRELLKGREFLVNMFCSMGEHQSSVCGLVVSVTYFTGFGSVTFATAPEHEWHIVPEDASRFRVEPTIEQLECFPVLTEEQLLLRFRDHAERMQEYSRDSMGLAEKLAAEFEALTVKGGPMEGMEGLL